MDNCGRFMTARKKPDNNKGEEIVIQSLSGVNNAICFASNNQHTTVYFHPMHAAFAICPGGRLTSRKDCAYSPVRKNYRHYKRSSFLSSLNPHNRRTALTGLDVNGRREDFQLI